jgi:hypothetical protein
MVSHFLIESAAPAPGQARDRPLIQARNDPLRFKALASLRPCTNLFETIRRTAPVAKEQETEDGRNRRQYERVKVSQPVKLEATLRGRFIDIMRLEMSGVTIDMSEGGFSANVDQSISPGVRCRVELPSEDGGDPKSLWGRVRRSSTGKKGYVVALEFDEPVEAAGLLGESADATLEIDNNGAPDDDEKATSAAKKKAAAKKKG